MVRKGSVGVNFQLGVIANVTDPYLPLRSALANNGGYLNGLQIDPKSITQGMSVLVNIVLLFNNV